MTDRVRARLAAGAFGILAAVAPPAAAPTCSEWSAPVNLAAVNTSAIEAGPSISKRGLSLYFHSDRAGGYGSTDIWVSQRSSTDEAWGPAYNVGPAVNGVAVESVASLSRDEHWLFFHSNRPGGVGGVDLWASYRANTHDDFGWEPAVNLGAVVNSAGSDAGATFFENERAPLLLFGSTRPGSAGFDIYVSAIVPGGFTAPAPVAELNSTSSDQRPSIRFDGLELVFASDRSSTHGGLDLWGTTRSTPSQPWGPPVNLGAIVNSAATDTQPFFSPDRETLLFASDRPGGAGSFDIYMAPRAKTRGR